ncbi:hypothetical protein ACFU5O_37405 [Streptomyces sp. NPDC057445]|uniref:hypothetical protein n=1 Tax=Streptomyces sp. NPDC057445 TaxID=3346136 RepID=UPI0036AC4643
MTARLDIPAHLRPPWRHLPGLAALGQRRLGPPALHPLTRPAALGLWLFALAVMHAGARLLGHKSAMLSVTGPRTCRPRRAACAAVFLLGTAAAVAWLWLPLQAADYAVAHHHLPPLVAYGAALTAVLALICEVGNMLLHGRAVFPASITVRRLRATGGTWWEAGTFAAQDNDPVSAGRLLHTALALADTHHIGLVAVPNSPATQRAYIRRGFRPGPVHPGVLVRTPQP